MDQEGNGVYSFDQEAGGSGHVPSSVDVGAAEAAAASGEMVVDWNRMAGIWTCPAGHTMRALIMTGRSSRSCG